MQLHKLSPWLIGLCQALIILAYILLLALLVAAAQYTSGFPLFDNQIIGMSFALLVFVFSALVCGGAALGYPIILLMEKKTKRAVSIICLTGLWLAIFLGVYIVIGLTLTK